MAPLLSYCRFSGSLTGWHRHATVTDGDFHGSVILATGVVSEFG